VLFGPFGTGKTSIVNALPGCSPDAGGALVLDDRLLDPRQEICFAGPPARAGYVFRKGRLFPHMSVRKNLL